MDHMKSQRIDLDLLEKYGDKFHQQQMHNHMDNEYNPDEYQQQNSSLFLELIRINDELPLDELDSKTCTNRK